MNDDRSEIYKREEEFHDSEFFGRKKISFLYADGATDAAVNCAYNSMGEIKGKRILEIGCGFGSHLIRMAKAGAHVTGIDISSVRVNETLTQISTMKLEQNANAIKMNAEKLEFPDSSFDIVFGASILHHLDLDLVLPEIKRILLPNGEAVFIEPLGENPLINYYRKRTPDLRTIDEHPFVEKDFALFRKYFNTVSSESFFLFSLFSYSFRTVIKNEKLFQWSSRALNKFDRLMIKTIPLLSKYCWQAVILLKK